MTANKKSNKLLLAALIISIVAILNPHIESGTVHKKAIREIKVYQEFAPDSRMNTYPYMDVFSADFECTKGVVLTNNFAELCNETVRLYCASRAMWEARGSGVCKIAYTKKTWFLKWF